MIMEMSVSSTLGASWEVRCHMEHSHTGTACSSQPTDH
jgi:hypothetical protein